MITIDNILEVERHIENIEAVIFDLDDTLYSEKEYVRSGYHAIAEYFLEIGTMEQDLWTAFEHHEPAIDVILQKYGLTEQKEMALHLYRFHKPEISFYNGVPEMLKRIRKTRKVGIITDGRPEGQRAKIEALGLSDKVDEIIITDELGGVDFRKPNEAAFRLMAEKLNVSFEKMVYVGDNIGKDFIAPDMLGMRSIFFKNCSGLYI